jgi:hypothetical protein
MTTLKTISKFTQIQNNYNENESLKSKLKAVFFQGFFFFTPFRVTTQLRFRNLLLHMLKNKNKIIQYFVSQQK